jgi:hypothetical protein
VLETADKKEIFVFDQIANPYSSQMDIYKMIGEECVDLTLQVIKIEFRGLTVAFSPMGKQEQERLTLFWEI